MTSASSVEITRALDSHALAKCQLLQKVERGLLKSEDYWFVFGQYYLFETGRIRCVSAMMAHCQDAAQRRRLGDAIRKEESESTSRQHQLVRFMGSALGLRMDELQLRDVTDVAIERYVTHCLTAHPADSLALLHITSVVLDRVYATFAKGLQHLDLAESAMASLRALVPAAFDPVITEPMSPSAREALNPDLIDRALNLHLRFADSLFRDLEFWRVSEILERIKVVKSLAFKKPNIRKLSFDPKQRSREIYSSSIDKLNVAFTVERVHFNCQVLDPRVVRIPPGKYNEKHKHAHETLFYIYHGSGEVQIDETVVPVEAGRLVFVPRWALHQSRNLGDDEMVIIAITDFGLTGDAYIGKYHSTARLNPSGDVDLQFLSEGSEDDTKTEVPVERSVE